MKKYRTVDAFITDNSAWAALLNRLREILLQTELKETIKWGIPVYTLNNKNVVGLGAFKEYAGLWFFNGVFLSDPQDKLVNAQAGKTKGMRQWRFFGLEECDAKLVLAYVEEAIENQKAGKEIKPARNKPLRIPPELQEALSADQRLNRAFAQLSLGLRREFAEHITAAKRPATKQRRLEKIIPMVLRGEGLNDRYR